ncbi:MAG TPA: Gx transporter family protein [Haploplasma sp.]|nr:Gx transporter family protein [Haploplasma sp.]
MNNKKKIRRLVILANLIAAAIVLSIIETAIAIIPVPGAKLGLANLITIVVLYMFSFKEALVVTLVRVFLVALLSPSSLGPTFYMGLAGGIMAVIAMGLFKKIGFGIILVSLLGSLSHQLGQIFAGIYVIGSSDIIYYLYIMLPLGVVTGIVNGFIAEKFIINLTKKQEDEVTSGL